MTAKILNIVCVSHNAPPLNDAEALCTARLLSALVNLGANAHLVAADLPATLDQSITDEILDRRVKVTYVRAAQGARARLACVARSLFHGNRIEWLHPAVSTTKEVLRQYRRPVLLTRAFPMVSNLVGYYCRSNAAAWVAHFSDPYPPHEWRSHWYSPLVRPINRRWARRILRSADLVTVTCPNAIRYIEEKTGYTFQHKAEVITHLALPKLKRGGFRLDRSPREFIVAHIGNLMARRRPDLLLKGATLVMERHPEIRFLQYGNVDLEVFSLCSSSAAFKRLDIRHVDNLSPRDAADLQEQVDVNVIVDTDLGLAYSPFLLSKYPHAVCAGKPLLMLTSNDSAMARFTQDCGGGELVPFSTPQAVADSITNLYNNRFDQSPRWVPRAKLMHEFGPERVLNNLAARLNQLLVR
jgi:glycosyltransferase involved in cell wall biosynthesis